MWNDILTALALVLVLEGIMPFLSPGRWKQVIVQILRLPERSLRTMGLAMMALGVTLLYIIN